MTTHNLKINKQPFDDLVSGRKTGEVRDCSDRDFKVGDSVELFMTETGTGLATESIVRTITHIQRGYGLPDDICVLSYATPVVERQPIYEVQWNSIHGPEGWKVVDAPTYARCQGPLWDRRMNWTAPPELAELQAELDNARLASTQRIDSCAAYEDELQATIARLTAENERLKGGQVVQICTLGMYGQAYDLPGTKRAYTYKEQPNNVAAYKLGNAVYQAAKKPGGDLIDQGLALLYALEEEGFGVFDLKEKIDAPTE